MGGGGGAGASLPKRAAIFKRQGKKVDLKHLSPDGTSKNPGPQPDSKPLEKRNSNEQLSQTFLPGPKERPSPAIMQAGPSCFPPELCLHSFL